MMLVSFLFFLIHLIFLFMFTFNSLSEGFLLEINLFTIFSINFSYVLVFDWISCCFSSFVFLITSLVMIYSMFYMHGDLTLARYFSLLILFVISMGILIFSPSLLLMMLGWDGLGLVSFCLVIYYSSPSSLRSGMITIYTNRLGDIALMIALVLSLNSGVWYNMMSLSVDFYLLGILIFLSAITKSAQFPFSSWLPAAMAAPTPISSLVHSSTLVTAGVYLLVRFYHSLLWLITSELFMILSSLTMLLAGFLACLETDMKKVIAMSTLSQLGLMMFMLSLGEWIFSYYHMVCHALFKSLLFLSCGVFISYGMGGQDMRIKTGYQIALPLSFFCFISSSLSLMGFPFLAGFYSSDLALEILFEGGLGIFSYIFFLLGCVFTVIYSLRLIYVGLLSSGVTTSLFSGFENVEVFISLIFLTTWSLFVGFYVGFYLVMDFFMIDLFLIKVMGIMVIFFGLLSFLVMFFISFYFYFKFLISDMLFMNWVSGFFSSSTVKSWGLLFLGDATWSEFIGASGIFNNLISFGLPFISFETKTLKLLIYGFFFWFIFLMYVVFLF